jgi:hypothetical protein
MRPAVSVFTSDAAVAAAALAAMPMIALMMPVDAGASIADGGFIAAGQTNMLSAIQVAGSLVQIGVLGLLAACGSGSALSVWAVLKLMSVFRFAGGAYWHFASRGSAYRLTTPAAAAAAAVAGAGAGAAAAALHLPDNGKQQQDEPQQSQQQPQQQPPEAGAPGQLLAGDDEATAARLRAQQPQQPQPQLQPHELRRRAVTGGETVI